MNFIVQIPDLNNLKSLEVEVGYKRWIIKVKCCLLYPVDR